jgi:Ca2+-binding RTX toxin-like protein
MADNLNLDIKDLIKDLSDKKAFGSLDLGDVLNLGGKRVSGRADLGDFFGGLSKVNLNGIKLDKVDFGDFLDGIGSFFGGITKKEFKVDKIFSELGNTNILNGIKLDSFFQDVSDSVFPIFQGVKVNDFIDVIDEFDVVDSNGNFDLLGGVGEVLDGLGDSGFLTNFVVDNLIFGGTGGIVGSVIKGALRGNSFLRGTDSLDKVLGQKGSDILTGLLGDDILNGGKGVDTLIGGKGIDELIGGKGKDRFVVEFNGSNDLITDFKNSVDRIAVLGKFDFNDLDIDQKGSSTVISVGGQDIATLKGVNSSLINIADFIFI